MLAAIGEETVRGALQVGDTTAFRATIIAQDMEETVEAEAVPEGALLGVPVGFREAVFSAYRHAVRRAGQAKLSGSPGLAHAEVGAILGPLGIQYWDDIFQLPSHEWIKFGGASFLIPASSVWV